MNYHILTLFPEMVMDGLNTSIIGRAVEKGLISIEAINIRDYSKDKHNHVDDAPYGGGAGMVMQPGPVCDSYEDLCRKIGKRPRVLYHDSHRDRPLTSRLRKNWRKKKIWSFCVVTMMASNERRWSSL